MHFHSVVRFVPSPSLLSCVATILLTIKVEEEEEEGGMEVVAATAVVVGVVVEAGNFPSLIGTST
jgi:hypothetical protein